MGASVSPVGKDITCAAFEKPWPAGTFSEQWVKDKQVILKEIKKTRDIHKLMILALSYGAGPKKIVDSLYERGIDISFKDAKTFRKVYWELFKGVRTFADSLEALITQKGYYINPFGYRITCDSRKAYNYFCQSSVSGIINIYTAKLFAAVPWALFLTIIHDEILLEIPEVRLEEFKEIKALVDKSLNEDLNWSVPIRFGCVPGKNWYEAK